MIAVTHLRGKKTALFGLGYSGIVTASALILGGCDVVVWDDDRCVVEKAYKKGFKTVDLRHISWDGISSLILSPGVALTYPQPHWVVQKAKACKTEIIGDLELFVRERIFFLKNLGLEEEEHACPLVAVTGTNGKSTTATLISHLLTHVGCKVELGGNIGVAALSLAPLAIGRVYLLECSSYQIELAPSLSPNIAILLNITPDHIDRHGNFSRYAAIKKQLLSAAKVAILNGDDNYCAAMINDLISDEIATVVAFGREKFFSDYCATDQSSLKQCFERWYFSKDSMLFSHREKEKFLVSLPQGVLQGRHGIHNTLAAVACCEILGFSLSDSDLSSTLRSFGGLPHRMEKIARYKHVLFVNDSKATNAEATAAALSTFDRIYWIVGGVAKAGGIESLRHLFSKIKKAFLIGDSAEAFSVVFLNERVPFLIVKTLENAVKHATCEAVVDMEREVVILLSPSCASFDQFTSYTSRGDMFRQLVHTLKF